MGIDVFATKVQMKDWGGVGRERDREALKMQLEDRCPAKAGAHVEGAQGEAAFGLATNRVWPRSVNTFGRVPDFPDLGGIEVKTANSKSYVALMIKEHEWHKEQVHVLVEHVDGTNHFIVHGWITTFEGMLIGKLCDPGNKGKPVYSVEISQLHSPYELVLNDASRIGKTA